MGGVQEIDVPKFRKSVPESQTPVAAKKTMFPFDTKMFPFDQKMLPGPKSSNEIAEKTHVPKLQKNVPF